MTVASGVDSPVQGFNFGITPILSGTTQSEQIFLFPNYMSGELVSIIMDQLEPGMSYTFSATAANIFGTSEASYSPRVQIIIPVESSTRKPGLTEMLTITLKV